LMRPPDAPKLLLLATVRTALGESSSKLRPFLAPEVVRSIDLHRLPNKEAEELVAVLLYSACQQSANDGVPRSEIRPAIDVEAVVSEAGGHPLFLDALVRHRLLRSSEAGPVRLEEALWARIQRLGAPERALLDLLSVSGRPVLQGVAARALETDFDDLSRRIAALRAANLARTSGTSHDELVEAFHDRIRETVVARLDPPSKRALHRCLAEALETTGRGDAETLALHWRDAGDTEKAAAYASRAGEQASAAMAFDRAARLFRMALDLHPRDRAERMVLYARRGDALANAGRGAEAAETYLGAARAAPPNEALELRRRAADNLLRSGYIDEGLRALRTVLAAVSMDLPRTPTHAIALLALRKVELRLRALRFEEQSEANIAPADLAKIDVCWTATLGLGMVDPLRSACFQAQNLLLSLRAGDPYRAARALALEAPFAAGSGTARARVTELLDQARALAARSRSPHALALVPACTGAALFLEGRFAQSLDALDRAELLLRERCTGVAWERATTLIFAAWSLWFLGDLRELARRFPLYLREAEERGDRYLEINLRASFSNAAWLLQNEPERAEREAEDAALHWSSAGFHLQHAFALVSRVEVDLYRGDGPAARRRLLERWHELEASQARRVQFARIHLDYLRARTALAAAPAWESRGDLVDELARIALSLERERERAPWADPCAATLRASLAARRRERAQASRELDRAIIGFEAASMSLHATVARRCQGELEGSEAGLAHVEQADRWMREQGVVAPDRLSAMLLPGRWRS
ncbi:MAG: serine/threonine-protein kinase PknK, partial [Minicystis sp.]